MHSFSPGVVLMREITVFSENRVGVLADICEALGGQGVNLKAISANGIGDKGIIRFITEDETTAKNVLERAGFRPTVSDVMIVRMREIGRASCRERVCQYV